MRSVHIGAIIPECGWPRGDCPGGSCASHVPAWALRRVTPDVLAGPDPGAGALQYRDDIRRVSLADLRDGHRERPARIVLAPDRTKAPRRAGTSDCSKPKAAS